MRPMVSAGPVERQLGWVVALVGVVQLAISTYPAFRASSGHPLWWNVAGLALAALIVTLAALGRVLPLRVLRCAWFAISFGLGLLGATAFAPSGFLGDQSPWPWTMDWTAYAFLALAVRRPAHAFIGPVAIGTLPGVSALVFLGEIPHDLAVQIPLRISGVGFTVLFLALRLRFRALHDSEQRAEKAEEQRVRSLAEADRRRRLSLLVHDHVLSVLNAAMLLGGARPDTLRAGAGAALELLTLPSEGESDDADDEQRNLGRRWSEAWRRIDPTCDIEMDVDDREGLPRHVATAVEDASLEALRNSVRHAPLARRAIAARVDDDGVEMLVRDTGPGFDPDAVPAERLGVRDSIVARVPDVGGAASVVSSLGTGTEVRIAWSRQE